MGCPVGCLRSKLPRPRWPGAFCSALLCRPGICRRRYRLRKLFRLPAGSRRRLCPLVYSRPRRWPLRRLLGALSRLRPVEVAVCRPFPSGKDVVRPAGRTEPGVAVERAPSTGANGAVDRRIRSGAPSVGAQSPGTAARWCCRPRSLECGFGLFTCAAAWRSSGPRCSFSSFVRFCPVLAVDRHGGPSRLGPRLRVTLAWRLFLSPRSLPLPASS